MSAKPLRKRPLLPESYAPTHGSTALAARRPNGLAFPVPRAVDGALKITTEAARPNPLVPKPRPQPRNNSEAVLRGIEDLQNLQKQTIAVLESVKGSLDEIQDVLRSPEATRGMEKQKNAAMLLAKGFAREAIEQASGAVALLPANPESHLLLSLALAADGDVSESLGMARKGLALFDRRQHPLAIEAGLLHALATLGCLAEALDRWSVIIDTLPLPVLLENLGRIGGCFPANASEADVDLLDDLLSRRIERDAALARAAEKNKSRRQVSPEGKVDLRPDDIPSPMLFSGLDAAREYRLAGTHRAILSQVARRLQLCAEAGDVVKFLGECLVPIANRGLEKSADALARAAVKRLLRLHADAMTLHRAMGKLELAGTNTALLEVATLLNHWRKAGLHLHRARLALRAAVMLLIGGLGMLVYALFAMNGGAINGHATTTLIGGMPFDTLWFGPALLALGGLVGLYALFGRTWHVALPDQRPALTAEERAFLQTGELKRAVRAGLGG